MTILNKDSSELWEFASALHLHGANAITLKTVLPNWTKSDIEFVLRKFKVKAARERLFLLGNRKARQAILLVKKEKDLLKNDPVYGSIPCSSSSRNFNRSALLTWSELVHKVHSIQNTSDKPTFGIKLPKKAPIKNHSTLIGKAMLYTACFEDHFHDSKEDGTLYSEIYRYFSQLLSGEEPTQLRPKSASKILEMVDRLTEMLQTGAFNDRINYLHKMDLSDIKKIPIAGKVPSPPVLKSSKEDISLFGDLDTEEMETTEESLTTAFRELDPNDPYFDEKRNKIHKMVVSVQQSVAASLHSSPGMNPLLLPAVLMTKPLKAFPENYPSRNFSMSSKPRASGNSTINSINHDGDGSSLDDSSLSENYTVSH